MSLVRAILRSDLRDLTVVSVFEAVGEYYWPRYFAVLHSGGVRSPTEAVKAAVAAVRRAAK